MIECRGSSGWPNVNALNQSPSFVRSAAAAGRHEAAVLAVDAAVGGSA